MSKSTANTYADNSVWPEFARMIKARDANKDGLCRCCTCGKMVYWKGQDCNAGHLSPSRSHNILFDEQVVHAQCVSCNKFKSGAQWEYVQFMRSKGYSYDEIEEMQNRKNIYKKFIKEDLKDLKKMFRAEADRIIKEKGLIE